MLDHTHAPECRFEGKTWNLQTMAGRRALRLRVKQVYMLLRNQGEIANLIESLCGCLQVDVQNVERALTTVRPAELAKAVLAGVDLQNHSWTHLNPQVFSERERTAEVLQNEEYLLQFRRVLTRTFAPPFGQQVILASVPADFVLLANRNLVPDHKEGNLINRGDLLLNDFPQNSPDSAASVRRIAA
jgi:peptidoglycan/xylan/chitin deacetylase (PgdA/CDA1 family)